MCVGEYSKSKFDVLDGWSLGLFHTEIGCGVGFSPTMRLFGWSSIEIENSPWSIFGSCDLVRVEPSRGDYVDVIRLIEASRS